MAPTLSGWAAARLSGGPIRRLQEVEPSGLGGRDPRDLAGRGGAGACPAGGVGPAGNSPSLRGGAGGPSGVSPSEGEIRASNHPAEAATRWSREAQTLGLRSRPGSQSSHVVGEGWF